MHGNDFIVKLQILGEVADDIAARANKLGFTPTEYVERSLRLAVAAEGGVSLDACGFLINSDC